VSKYELRLRMRTGTARVIEEAICDRPLKAHLAGEPVERLDLGLARAIARGFQIRRTRAVLDLPDQSDLLKRFVERLGEMTSDKVAVHSACRTAIRRLIEDTNAFLSVSVIDKLAKALKTDA
jgi:hypothetical protein